MSPMNHMASTAPVTSSLPAPQTSHVPQSNGMQGNTLPHNSQVVPGTHLPPPVPRSELNDGASRREEGVAGSYFPHLHHEDRLPSIRSIVSGSDIRNVISRIEALPQISYSPPNHASAPMSQRYLTSQPYDAYNPQATVAAHRFLAGNQGNPSVSHQSSGCYSHNYAAYHQYPRYPHLPAEQAGGPQSVPSTFGSGHREHAPRHLPPMEPSMTPYSMGPHMHVADARTPTVHVSHLTAPTPSQLPTGAAHRPMIPVSLMTPTSAYQRPIGEPYGAGTYQHGITTPPSYHSAIQESAIAGGSTYASVPGLHTQGVHAYQQRADVAQEDQRGAEQNWRYVAPGSAGAEELTEVFLSQITARAYVDEERNIRCSECEEEFGNIASWKRHASRAHRKEQTPKVRCPICSIEVQNEGNIKRHMKTVHKTVPDPFICSHCPAMFSSDRARSIHVMRIHTVPVETDLSVTGGVRRRRGRRGASGTKAEKRKMHRCPNCEYVSRWKGNIARHVNAVHLALRQFPCDRCDRRFNTASNLAVHQMTHMREDSLGA